MNSPSNGRTTRAAALRAPVLRAVLALALAGALTAGAIQAAWRWAGVDPPLWVKIAGAGALAALIGLALRLPVWWLALLAVAPAAIVGALTLDLPAWSYALALALTALVMVNGARERVPLYLTGAANRRALAALIDPEAPVRAVDLGCGLAGPLLALARANRHPNSRFLGVETAPIPFALAWLRVRFSGDARIAVRFQSLWRLDLGGFDLIYAFLSPAPMPRLMEKAAREMRDGALFVSNEFTDAAYGPDRRLEPAGPGGRPLNLWRAPLVARRGA
ncbi:MAG: class I SAM-dependent methyltransferase [Alphaproteobacteria bacterium]|nr:class I SAM-dependent methyltransferase [Alphaproteobacteria bacterium]